MIRGTTAFVIFLALATSGHAEEQFFNVSNTTMNCRDGNKVTHEVCLPGGKTIRGAPNISVVRSSGIQADYESKGVTPNRPNCWQIVTTVMPLGEDCLKLPLVSAVCNCKGQGFIELRVGLTPQ
jgi:hypothetical protein